MRETLYRFAERLHQRSGLNAADLEAICLLPATTIVVRPGLTIYDQDSEAGSFSIVHAGLAANFRQSRSGMRQITALRIAGDPVDPAATVLGRTPTGLSAIDEVTLLRVPLSVIRDLQSRRPRVSQALYLECASDAAKLARIFGNSRRLSAIARVAHLLCDLAVRYRGVGLCENNKFNLAMTQTDIGDAIGATPVHVNRVMQMLRLNGLIDTSGKTLTILDWDQLARLAELDPAPCV